MLALVLAPPNPSGSLTAPQIAVVVVVVVVVVVLLLLLIIIINGWATAAHVRTSGPSLRRLERFTSSIHRPPKGDPRKGDPENTSLLVI